MKFAKLLPIMAIVMLLSFVAAGAALGEDEVKVKGHKIIRIHYVGGINQDDVTVAPGTTVIWVNDSRASMEIQFEGKQVTVACKSPVHFIVDDKGSFLSDRIPQGSVASLCFVEKGVFSYTARKVAESGTTYPTRASISEFKGKITVK